jgi:hypothetical protein
MFHVKQTAETRSLREQVSRETFNEYGPFSQEWFHVKQLEAGPSRNVSRETSVLDEARKTELNGSGSTQCR